jgi:hypothetical protein
MKNCRHFIGMIFALVGLLASAQVLFLDLTHDQNTALAYLAILCTPVAYWLLIHEEFKK